MFRIILGPAVWRRMDKEQFYNLYCLPNFFGDQIKYDMGGTCNLYQKDSNAHTVLVRNREEKRLLRRPGRRWNRDIKILK
jgi:hypothetical protein